MNLKRKCEILEKLLFIKFKLVPIEKKIDPDQNYFKTEILQTHCSLFCVIDMNYQVNECPNHFTASQPEMFAKHSSII